MSGRVAWLCSSSQTLENATYFTAHEPFNANPGDVITAPEATVVVELQLETCLVENIFSSLDMLIKNWSKNEGLDMPGLAPKLVKLRSLFWQHFLRKILLGFKSKIKNRKTAKMETLCSQNIALWFFTGTSPLEKKASHTTIVTVLFKLVKT